MSDMEPVSSIIPRALSRWRLPAGIELPDGRVLTFEAHRECGCDDCTTAWREYEAGRLEVAEGFPPTSEGGV